MKTCFKRTGRRLVVVSGQFILFVGVSVLKVVFVHSAEDEPTGSGSPHSHISYNAT